MAKLDLTKPLRSVGGKFPARCVVTDREWEASSDFCTHAFLVNKPGRGEEVVWGHADGTGFNRITPVIENVPDPAIRYFNTYSREYQNMGGPYLAADDARLMRTTDWATLVEVQMIDGKIIYFKTIEEHES